MNTFHSLLVVALALPAGAATITIPAAADATLYASPTGALANGGGDYLFAGVTADGNIRRTVIRFDIAAALPPGAIVQNAQLTLFADRARLTPAPSTLHRVTASWSEGVANTGGPEGQGSPSAPGATTWIHRDMPGTLWSAPGGDFISTPSATASTATGFIMWSDALLTADVALWNNQPAQNFGWEILGVEYLTQTAARFHSRTSLTTSNRPALTITYTTVPESRTALAAVTVAIALSRRLRSRSAARP